MIKDKKHGVKIAVNKEEAMLENMLINLEMSNKQLKQQIEGNNLVLKALKKLKGGKK